MGLDWKPRGRDNVMGGIGWLPRIVDKARAHLNGSLGDYIYPCPADKAWLQRTGISAEDFTKLVKENPSDELMIQKIRAMTGGSGS